MSRRLGHVLWLPLRLRLRSNDGTAFTSRRHSGVFALDFAAVQPSRLIRRVNDHAAGEESPAPRSLLRAGGGRRVGPHLGDELRGELDGLRREGGRVHAPEVDCARYSVHADR